MLYTRIFVFLVYFISSVYGHSITLDVLERYKQSISDSQSSLETFDLTYISSSSPVGRSLRDKGVLNVTLKQQSEQVKGILEETSDLQSSTYTQRREVWKDGVRMPELDEDIPVEECKHYQGILENNNGYIALSTCNKAVQTSGLLNRADIEYEGSILTKNGEMYGIQMMDTVRDISNIKNKYDVRKLGHHVRNRKYHIVYNLNDLKSSKNSSDNPKEHFCNAKHVDPAHTTQATHASTDNRHIQSFNTTSLTSIKYIEMFVYNDFSRYTQHNNAPESNTIALINQVSQLYKNGGFNRDIRVVLQGQVTFNTGDPWFVDTNCATCGTSEVSSDRLLEDWTAYSNANNVNGDVRHLFSGYNFDGATLGLAYVGVDCNGNSRNGINEVRDASLLFNAVIITHEVGHNLGASHDGDNGCANTGFVMSPSVNRNSLPSFFSSCSIVQIENNIAPLTCYDNIPPSAGTCGDGIVDFDEDCDCGAPDCAASHNPCCDGSTCKLLSTAVCSALDACCMNCQQAPPSTICRSKANTCDVAETCSGVSSTCGTDLYSGAGIACDTNIQSVTDVGACYQGTCKNYAEQCQKQGVQPCHPSLQAQEGVCGALQCSNTYHGMQCSKFIGITTLQVEDGTTCGANQQCLGGACLSSSEVAKSTNPYAFWEAAQWDQCFSCDETQSRSLVCQKLGTNEPVANIDHCGIEPITQRACLNQEVGCNGDFTTIQPTRRVSANLFLFGTPIDKSILISTGVIAAVQSMFFVYCCGRFLTEGMESEEAGLELNYKQ